MSKIFSIPPLPEKKTRKSKVVAEEDPSHMNEHEVKFSTEELFAHLTPPDLSMLNLHHPKSEYHAPRMVLYKPECGMIFIDINGKYSSAHQNYTLFLQHTRLIYLFGFSLTSMELCLTERSLRVAEKEE